MFNISKNIHLIGNAHIDPVWFWRWQEGYAEVKATFRSALDRINEFPGFIFTSACAAYYKWVEDNEPGMFEEIRRRVSEGRWHVAGGMWIQPDCNAPSGESFARHLLQSQRYFLEKFGARATVGYNVDSFGHNGSLPKILCNAGIDSYVMMRPGSHENPDVPFGAFWWESQDGSRVLTFRIDEKSGYGCGNNSGHNRERMDRCASESDRLGIPFMCFYGVGNHGGGPTIEILNQIIKHQNEPGGERFIFSQPRRFFDEVKSFDIPVWTKDLQWHASGCYSAMSEIKMNNRRVENRLLQAEKFASLSHMLTRRETPGKLLNRAWQGALFNQFHDVMGGCSAREAYEDARELHGQALSVAAEVSNAAVQAVSWGVNTMGAGRTRRSKESDWNLWELDNMGTPIVVFNSLSWRRQIPVQLSRPVKSVRGDGGAAVPVQIVRASRTNNEDKWDSLFVADVPAMGYAVYWAYLGKQEGDLRPPALKAEGARMENECLSFEIDPESGGIASLFDKTLGKEMFTNAAGVPLVIDIEHVDTWAHNVFSFRDVCGMFKAYKVTLLENGPVRAKLRVYSRYGASELIQDYMLYEGGREIMADVRLDWREHFKMLKLSFQVFAADGCATYDIPYGTIRRPAKGAEEPGQMWFDVSSNECGLSILNNGKYSFDVLDNEMRMTVANGSMYADHYAGEHRDDLCDFLDQGIQRFSYALRPHGGEWIADTVKKAMELNTEETHVNETYHEGPLPRVFEGVEVSAGNVVITAFKPAYDGNGYVLRLCEYEGKETPCGISLPAIDRRIDVVIPKYAVKSFWIPEDKNEGIRECDLTEELIS